MMLMKKRFSYGFGAALALFAAGPTFILSLILGTLLTGPIGNFGTLGGFLAVAVFSIPFGMVLGALPISLGGFVMGYLGVSDALYRHYGVWGCAGAIVALPMPVLLGFDTEWESMSLFAFTGAICALIVRYGTRWSEEKPTPFSSPRP